MTYDNEYVKAITKATELLAIVENLEPIIEESKERDGLSELAFIAEELRSKITQHTMTWTEEATKLGECPASLWIYAQEKGWTKWMHTR